MAAPVLMPRVYGVPLPQPEVLPEKFREIVEHYRAHPAGAFAMRIFDEHGVPTKDELSN